MHVTVAMQSGRAKAGDFSSETKRYDRSWAANELVGTRGGPLRSLINASCVLRPEQAQKRRSTDVDPLAHWLHTRKHCATAVELDITLLRAATHKISIYYNCQTSAST